MAAAPHFRCHTSEREKREKKKKHKAHSARCVPFLLSTTTPPPQSQGAMHARGEKKKKKSKSKGGGGGVLWGEFEGVCVCLFVCPSLFCVCVCRKAV